MKKQANEWMKYAEIDMLSIGQLITNKALTQAVAFHAHQCVEKSLKAILELLNKRVPRIHDLRKLFTLVTQFNIRLDIDNDSLDELNQIYIDTRYPADYGILPSGIPSIEEAEMFEGLAKKVFSRIRNIIDTCENPV